MPAFRSWLPWAVLCGVAAIVYAPVFELQWIWDDDQYITENPLLRDWQGLRSIWTRPNTTPQYYPVVFTLLWAQFQVFGLNAAGYHGVNLCLHAFNGCLCFSILKRLQIPAAFAVALAFVLHPVQVETVAWVTELKNLASAAFYGLAWICLWPLLEQMGKAEGNSHESEQPAEPTGGQSVPQHAGAENAGRKSSSSALGRQQLLWAAVGVACFLLALLSKSVTASLPAAMLVACWYQFGKFPARAVLSMLPLLLVGALLGWNTARLERIHVGALGGEWDFTLADRISIAVQCLTHYARQLAFPFEQIFFYPRFEPGWGHASAWLSLAVCLLAAGLAIGLAAVRGRRGPAAALAFFAGSAFPALGFLNVYPHRFSFVADHFIYIASVGMLCVLVGGLHSLALELYRRLPALRGYRPQVVFALPCVLLFSWYAWGVVSYLPAFTNPITLWEDTLRKNPRSVAAMQNLGLAYIGENRPQAAVTVLEHATQFAFDRYQSFNSLGLALGMLGRTAEARAAFEQSVALQPDQPRAWNNLANLTLSNLSEDTERREQQVAQAHAFYERSWAASPSYLAALGLGSIDYQQGAFLQAAKWFRRAADLRPDDVDAHYNLAQSLLAGGKRSEARAVCLALLEFAPNDLATRSLLSSIQEADKDENDEGKSEGSAGGSKNTENFR